MIRPSLHRSLADLRTRAAETSGSGRRVVAIAVVALLAVVPSGCAGRRYSQQLEVDAMRAEYYELEDRYYETLGRLEAAERKLERHGLDQEREEDDAARSGAGGARTNDDSGLLPLDGRIDSDDPEPNPMPEAPAVPNDLPEPGNLPGPDARRRPIGAGIRNAGRAVLNPGLDRLSARTRRVGPNVEGRDYRDPSETAADRNRRHQSEAARAGVPYFPNPDDDRELLAASVDDSSAGDEGYGPPVESESIDDEPGEIGWQEPRIGEPLPVDEVDELPIDDWEVVAVGVDRRQTAGFDANADGIDDGISLVIHPRNASGQTIPVFAPMSIAVIDPAERGEAQRIGLWKFTADELAYRQPATARPSDGIALRLNWTRGIPRHGNLAVFVRYEAPDGQQYEDRLDVAIALRAGERSAWTARPTPFRSAADGSASGSAVPRPGSPTPVREVGTGSRSGGSTVPPPSRPIDTSIGPQTNRPAWSPFR
ncbi:MAG TPA: hypothetical protein DCQ98_09505 [Planctomycetaceae bacterium]|nr:hypothetical protein [Planctomycetaceae bacterium]